MTTQFSNRVVYRDNFHGFTKAYIARVLNRSTIKGNLHIEICKYLETKITKEIQEIMVDTIRDFKFCSDLEIAKVFLASKTRLYIYMKNNNIEHKILNNHDAKLNIGISLSVTKRILVEIVQSVPECYMFFKDCNKKKYEYMIKLFAVYLDYAAKKYIMEYEKNNIPNKVKQKKIIVISI